MKQRTLAMMTGFEQYTKKTRRAQFLEEMEQVVPWRELGALVEPHYPKPGNGRPPVGVERMLRIYFLQQWFNLSDPAVEEALYDSAALRARARSPQIDEGRDSCYLPARRGHGTRLHSDRCAGAVCRHQCRPVRSPRRVRPYREHSGLTAEGTFPATVVIATTRTSGARSAIISATASSEAVSVSIRKARGTRLG